MSKLNDFNRKQNIKFAALIVLTALSVLGVSFVYTGGAIIKQKKHMERSEFTVNEAYEFLKANKENGNVVVLDLRTPAEYKEGHIEGSLFLDYFNEKTKNQIQYLDPTKDYLLIDKSGRLQQKFMKKLRKRGFTEAHKVKGGFAEWMAQNIPLDYKK